MKTPSSRSIDEPTADAIVIPETGAPSCVTFAQSVGPIADRVIVATETGRSPASCSRYCDEVVHVPAPTTSLRAYGDALLSLARRPDVRTIVPTSEADAVVLARRREAFAEHVATLWPPQSTLERVHDRLEMVDAANEAGVAVPESRLLDEIEHWEPRQIVKARYVALTAEYDETASPDDFLEPTGTTYLQPDRKPDYDQLYDDMAHVPLVQRYVPGTEYSFWALYDEGDPIATCHKRQLRAWSYAGGTSIARETVYDPQLEATGRALLDHLDWHGFAAVQFIKSEQTGEYTLLEVNPRLWISLSCAVRAGADFPRYFWELATDGSATVDDRYALGTATHLPRGEVAYLLSVLKDEYAYVEPPTFETALREIASTFSDGAGVDYFHSEDPRPFVCDFVGSVSRQFRQLK